MLNDEETHHSASASSSSPFLRHQYNVHVVPSDLPCKIEFHLVSLPHMVTQLVGASKRLVTAYDCAIELRWAVLEHVAAVVARAADDFVAHGAG